MMKKIMVVILMLAMMGLCACGNKETNVQSQNKNTEGADKAENAGSTEDTESVIDTEIADNTENAEDTETAENTESVDNTEKVGDAEDTELTENGKHNSQNQKPDTQAKPETSVTPETEKDSQQGTNTEAGKDSEKEETPSVTTATYTVNVKTKGNMAMSGIAVNVYADSALTDVKGTATTNEEGSASFTLVEGKNYYISLSGAPKGYAVEKSYSFSRTTANIALTSSLITGEDILTASLGVGDVMYDFTVTTPEGVQLTLSELLKEKKMVMLNFWFANCTWCVKEFPYMSEAYEMYKDDIEIIALNHWDGEDTIVSFKESNSIPFYMAGCDYYFPEVFGIGGYPTSVYIDRYGVICAVEPGAVLYTEQFTNTFEHYTADNYQQELFLD